MCNRAIQDKHPQSQAKPQTFIPVIPFLTKKKLFKKGNTEINLTFFMIPLKLYLKFAFFTHKAKTIVHLYNILIRV